MLFWYFFHLWWILRLKEALFIFQHKFTLVCIWQMVYKACKFCGFGSLYSGNHSSTEHQIQNMTKIIIISVENCLYILNTVLLHYSTIFIRTDPICCSSLRIWCSASCVFCISPSVWHWIAHIQIEAYGTNLSIDYLIYVASNTVSV